MKQFICILKTSGLQKPTHRNLFGAFFALLTLLLGCTYALQSTRGRGKLYEGSQGPTSRPALTPTPCKYQLGDGFTENKNLVCASLRVKLNRSLEDGNTINLHVMRLLPDKRVHTPLVRLLGGPGAPASQVVSQPRSFFSDILAERELIVFDQRGAGRSEPNTSCPEIMTEGLDGLRPCLDRLSASGVDASSLSVQDSADDVADLASALGAPAIDLWGISYGTRLGLEVLRRHPQIVRAAVLDSLVLPNVPFTAYSGANLEHSLRTIEAVCKADGACASAFPGSLVDDAIQTLSQAPLRLADGSTLDTSTFLQFMSTALFAGGAYDLVPLFIDSVRKRSSAGVQDIQSRVLSSLATWSADPGASAAIRPPKADAMGYSALCSDFKFTLTDQLLQNALNSVSPLIAKVFRSSAETDRSVCSQWPTKPDSAGVRPVTSDAPVLLMSGALDPVTPPEWAESAAKTLSAAKLVVFKKGGHGSSRSPCGNQVLLSYLNSPDKNPDKRCADDERFTFVQQ